MEVEVCRGGYGADDSLIALLLLIVLWWASCEVVFELRQIREGLTAGPVVEQEVE